MKFGWKEAAGVPARWAGAALDALLPQRCLGCGTIIDSAGAICPACWSTIEFLAPPVCDCCGVPFPHKVPAETLRAACTARPPGYDRARGVRV